MDSDIIDIRTDRLLLTEMVESDYDVWLQLYYEGRPDEVKKMMDNPEISGRVSRQLRNMIHLAL